MTNGTIYSTILMILRKEGRGNLIKPAQMTYLLQECDLEYYNQQYEKWGGSQTLLDSLRPFQITDESVTFSSNIYALSSLDKTYKHAIAARLSSSNINCDIVTPSQWNEWAGDSVMKATAVYPLIMIDSININILPTADAAIKFSYLKANDAAPVFDYYIDAKKNIQYLANAATHLLATGEVGSAGQTAGTTVTGASVELEWGDQDKVNIISIMLEKIGVSLSSPEITQYAMGKEQQQNVM